MTSGFQPRLDILPAAQQAIWPHLSATAAHGYVLYGGTAIALRFGHRASVDFDFFTDHPLDEGTLRSAIPVLAQATTLQESTDTLTVIAGAPVADRNVKISFFGNIRFGRVGDPEWTPDRVLQVASLRDLMATKLKVLLQRVESRDYRDVAAMIRSGADLATGLASAQRLFGGSFQPSECLKALTWFEGGDLDTLPRDDRDLLIKAASSVRELPVVNLVSRSLSAERA